MFGKKKVVKEVPVVSTPEPQVAEEFSEESEKTKSESVETEAATAEEELTNDQVKAILENMASDLSKIKYHLRLDF